LEPHKEHPGAVSSEYTDPFISVTDAWEVPKHRFPTLGRSKGLCSFSPVEG